ncbi:hypothetical protein NDGK_01227 [Clostridiales bacterium CHKCI001]|nr:hypothetical protein NDGK_01227 [Clostridiales bacterium CHKCI001]
MTYQEKLKIYQSGGLSEEERKEVEYEIEKYEAISNYLYEQESVPSLDELLLNPEGSDEKEETLEKKEINFAELVNHSIHRAFRRLGIIIVTVSLAIVLFIQFALPHIVSMFYYDPSAKNGTYGNQMSLDMAVYSELFLPCMRRDTVVVEDNGYGNYDISINQTATYTGQFINVSGEIKRGKLKLFDTNILKEPTENAFAWYQVDGDKTKTLEELLQPTGNEHINMCAAGEPEEALKIIQELDDREKYIGYVSLNQLMDYESFMKYMENYDNLGSLWCAVQTEEWTDEHMFRASNIGFSCDLDWSTQLSYDEMIYPELILWQSEENMKWDKIEENIREEQYMTTHFTSLLNYLSDQKEFCSMMGKEPQALKEIVKYVSNYGLEVYGFAAIMSKQLMLELSEQPEIYEIYVQKIP